MINNLELKMAIVLLAIITLLLLRAWVQAEAAISWYYHEFHKEPRIPGRCPKPSRLRKLLYLLFQFKNHNQ